MINRSELVTAAADTLQKLGGMSVEQAEETIDRLPFEAVGILARAPRRLSGGGTGGGTGG